MRSNRNLWMILVACCLALLVYLWMTSSHMPPRIAVHFGVDGVANGWMTPKEHILFVAGFGVGLPFFVALVFTLASHLPDHWINIPNRAYWLAVERRKATEQWIQRQGLWLAYALVAFAALIHHSILRANSTDVPNLSSGLIVPPIAVLLSAVIVSTALMLRRFRKPTQL